VTVGWSLAGKAVPELDVRDEYSVKLQWLYMRKRGPAT